MNSSINLRRIAFLLVLIAAVLSGAYWWRLSVSHERMRADAVARASKHLVQLADGQADHIEALLLGVDMTLRQFRDTYRDKSKPAAEAIALTALGAFPAGALGLFSIIDAQGYIHYSTLHETGRVYVGDREYFTFHRDSGEDRLYINKPVVSRTTNNWLVLMTRPLFKHKRFAGVALVSLSPEYLAATLAKLDMGSGDVATILFSDGAYLARSRGLQDVLGTSLPPDRPFLNPNAPALGVFRAVANADKVPRIFAWGKLERYPLVINVGFDEGAVLAPVEREIDSSRKSNLIGFALLLALLAVVLALLMRTARQQEALADGEAMLRSTLDSTDDGILVVGSGGAAVNANRRFYELWRVPEEIAATGQDERLLGHVLDQLVDPAAFMRDVAELNAMDVERWDTLHFKDGRVFERFTRAFLHRGQRVRLLSFRDVTEPRGIHDALEFVAQRGWYETGASFFPSLVKYLANATGVAYAMVDRLVDGGRSAETVALYAGGDVAPNMRYELRDTPCETVAGKKLCCYPRDVQKLFSRDGLLVDMRAESYMGIPLWDSGGKPVGLIALIDTKPMVNPKMVESILQIVATRAAAELERLRGEADLRKLSLAVEQSPASIVITDRLGTIEYVNPRFEELTGYTREEAVGQNPRILKSGQTAPEVYQDLWKTITSGGEWRGELCNRKKNGELFWESAAISGLIGEDGGVTHYVAVKDDVTARKAADELLRESERRFSTVFRANPVGISITRVADGMILDVNDAVLRLYDYRREEVVGRTVAELGIYADPEARAKLLETLRAQEQVDGFEFRSPDRSGTLHTLAISARINQVQGEDCIFAMLVDITERKRLNEARLNSQKLEAMGTLAGGIAHDFNNILAAILGNAALAKKDVVAGQGAGALVSLEEIDKAGGRARDLVQQILAFSRRQPQNFAIQPLRSLVEEALRLLRATLPAGVELAAAFADTPLHVRADATQIGQVMVNLCTNAWQALQSSRGHINVSLDAAVLDAGAAQRLGGLAPGRYARLAVKDNGCGMDEATQARMFEPFYTTKPVDQGTGLGLAVVHGIVKAHQGMIAVQSAPGMGTAFEVYLPAVETPAQVAQFAPEAKAAADGQGKHVLYVDDDEAIVFLVRRMLENLGYRVSGFDRGEAALAAVRGNPGDFNLIVTDFNMPGLSGLEVAAALQRIRPELPVVITSGYISDELTAGARAAGVRQVVYKPNTVDELCATIRQLLANDLSLPSVSC